MLFRSVLRPGGSIVNLATNWDSLVWHSKDNERMKRVLSAWDEHAPHPNLPAELKARLASVGIKPQRQTALTILENSYNQNSFSFWLAKMIAAFVAGRQPITPEEADGWLSEFDSLEQSGEYFYSATPVITEAVKVK